MNPKQIAGISAAAGLGVIGLFGVGFNEHARSKRDLHLQQDNDYDVEVDEVVLEAEFNDPWESNTKNASDQWRALNLEFGIELENDDVLEKARKQRGLNWGRLREGQLASIHDKMIQEFQNREDKLTVFNEISSVAFGRRDPKEMGDEENDETGDYAGFDRTAPVVQNFLDSFGCQADGKNLWRKGGVTNVWGLFPQSIPLFTDADSHVSDWGAYWNFFQKIASSWPTRNADIRFSMGTYSNTVSFTPRGYRYRANVPWGKMQRYYKKPKMSALAPRIFSALRSLLTYLPRYGVSTATAGNNCVLFWFFQDIPSDLDDFIVPEQFEMIEELHSLCTVIPVIIGPNAKSDNWKNFAANLVPGLQTKYAKDADYSGAYFVNTFDELMDDKLMAHINNYQCLIENRAACRIVADAWIPPASDTPTGADPTEGFRAVIYDDEPTDAPEVAEATTAPGPATTGGAVTTAKVPEIDSCCGHDAFSSTPFDSELRTCCEDGQVRAYAYEGDDPCAGADFFKK
jgi:hypothetical protein